MGGDIYLGELEHMMLMAILRPGNEVRSAWACLAEGLEEVMGGP